MCTYTFETDRFFGILSLYRAYDGAHRASYVSLTSLYDEPFGGTRGGGMETQESTFLRGSANPVSRRSRGQ